MTLEFETPPPDQPTRRSRVSRRVIAGVGAAMLVAAAGGVGFGLGRSVGSDDQIDTASSGAADPPPATDAPERETLPPDTTTVDTAVASTDVPAETVPALDSVDEQASALDSGDDGAIASSGGGGYSVFGSEEMNVLFERTTDTGLSLRAQLGSLWPTDQFGYEAEGWQPPAWCFQSGEVRLAMSGGGVIDVGGVGWFAEPYQGRAISWLTLGRADGSPHRIVFTQAPEGTTSVTATFGDGSVDVVTPQNGVAVLVAAGAPETVVHDEDVEYGGWIEELPDFTVTFERGDDAADGVTVSHDQIGNWDDPDFAASCSPPPPALPEPGEQPADPAAAEAEIVAAMTRLYGGADDDTPALDLLDDATGVAEAREQVSAGGFESEATNAQAVVEELVFTTPTESWFRYRIDTGGIGLRDRYGIAVQIDGVWLITRATLCQDLGMAGGSCGDDVGTVRPPGFEYETFIDEAGFGD